MIYMTLFLRSFICILLVNFFLTIAFTPFSEKLSTSPQGIKFHRCLENLFLDGIVIKLVQWAVFHQAYTRRKVPLSLLSQQVLYLQIYYSLFFLSKLTSFAAPNSTKTAVRFATSLQRNGVMGNARAEAVSCKSRVH